MVQLLHHFSRRPNGQREDAGYRDAAAREGV